jgi:hypothetical protein
MLKVSSYKSVKTKNNYLKLTDIEKVGGFNKSLDETPAPPAVTARKCSGGKCLQGMCQNKNP